VFYVAYGDIPKLHGSQPAASDAGGRPAGSSAVFITSQLSIFCVFVLPGFVLTYFVLLFYQYYYY
jgi:hypothetical protein